MSIIEVVSDWVMTRWYCKRCEMDLYSDGQHAPQCPECLRAKNEIEAAGELQESELFKAMFETESE